MRFNVAELLKSPVGTTRRYTFEDRASLGEEKPSEVKGDITIMRIDRGVLVTGDVDTSMVCNCSRCLEAFDEPVEFHMEEEYLPTIDIVSGVKLPPPENDETFQIDEHHVIDLTEATRQYAIIGVPMKPLCSENCQGLCPTCGANLNEAPCDCPKTTVDPRWSKLAELSSRLERKEKRRHGPATKKKTV